MFSRTFFSTLASLSSSHSPSSDFYLLLNELVTTSIATTSFASKTPDPQEFGEFGTLSFPLYNFGNLSSLALFGLDELILFSFYLVNKNRYKNVLDIGANIGLHSVLMSKLGWNVTSFEPDPVHCSILASNLESNKCTSVTLVPKAVYNSNSLLTFLRVEGNTTGSHIQGMKKDPYGKLSELQVECIDIVDTIDAIDFIKLDAEGAEHDIIIRIPPNRFNNLDIMAEVSTEENARLLFDYMTTSCCFNIFAQKQGWKKVSQLSDLPTSHRGGSVFISSKEAVPFF